MGEIDDIFRCPGKNPPSHFPPYFPRHSCRMPERSKYLKFREKPSGWGQFVSRPVTQGFILWSSFLAGIFTYNLVF